MELIQVVPRIEDETFEHFKRKRDIGKYLLIKETKLIDTFNDYEDALNAAYKVCGINSFYIRKVEASDFPLNDKKDQVDRKPT